MMLPGYGSGFELSFSLWRGFGKVSEFPQNKFINLLNLSYNSNKNTINKHFGFDDENVNEMKMFLFSFSRFFLFSFRMGYEKLFF